MKQKWCNQSKLNLSIDIIMLLLLMPLAGIGFLIKYVLIPGIQRNERYGAGVELEFWGLTRHQWGSIHLIISIVFLVLLLLHIILHWKMIVGIFKRMFPDKALCAISATLIAGTGLLMIVFPLFVKPEIVTRKSLHLNRKIKQETLQIASPGEIRKEVSKEADKDVVVFPRAGLNKPKQTLSGTEFVDLEINGRQTLQFVANKFGIPVEKVAADLNIPSERSGERLGRLRRQYAFTMNDVRKSILKNKE
jgi:hypothetical protein